MSAAIRCAGVVPAPPAGAPPPPLSLEVSVGSFCLLGARPAHFAPLLRALVGLSPPLAGRLEVLGVEPARLGRSETQRFRRRLGVGLRPGGLTSNQTLQMNVATPLLYGAGASLAAATRRAGEVLEECGIGRWAGHRPDDTPPDVRQAAVIARAIARGPELLLLEDPFSAMEPAQVERLLGAARRAATSILLATHQTDLALRRFADTFVPWNPMDAG